MKFWAVRLRTWLRLTGSLAVVAMLGSAWYVWTQFEPMETPTDFAIKAEAARLRDGGDDYRMALRYIEGEGVVKSPKEALVWLERSAQQGFTKAQYELGMALKNGIGVAADSERAVTWLRLAAEAQDPRAQFEVGMMYSAGRGTRFDRVKGFVWLSLAAAQGVIGAADARDTAMSGMSPAEAALAKEEARRTIETRLATGMSDRY